MVTWLLVMIIFIGLLFVGILVWFIIAMINKGKHHPGCTGIVCGANCCTTGAQECCNGECVAVGTTCNPPANCGNEACGALETCCLGMTSGQCCSVSQQCSGGQCTPSQTGDLRVVNNCDFPMWVEGRYLSGPIPGYQGTRNLLASGDYFDYLIPPTGLTGTSFWPKYGCDSNGENCLIGDHIPTYPENTCPNMGCTPPIDSEFQFNWGASGGTGVTFFSINHDQGYTFPYKLSLLGDIGRCSPLVTSIDGSALDVTRCPTTEDLTQGGQFPSVVNNGITFPLNSVNLAYQVGGYTLGCVSPCQKLTGMPPSGYQQPAGGSGAAALICCSDPNISEAQCNAGPLPQTHYVNELHLMAPQVDSYIYDGAPGIHQCPAKVTKYQIEWCPVGSPMYPGIIQK